jgi:predicted O-methyltransferase YrrM
MNKFKKRIIELKKLENKLFLIKDVFDVVHSDVDLDEYDKSKKLKEKNFPYSCSDEEGLILYLAVKKFKLIKGFEVATAFGYSSLFLGLALKENNGKLTSIDCYIEEWKDSYLYSLDELVGAVEIVRQDITNGICPIGLNYAISNRDKLGMKDVIEYKIGISPSDLSVILDNQKIDVAFIDGGHFGEQPTKDFLGILPFLEEKCIVFFHDNNQNQFVKNAIKIAENEFGTKALNLNTKYNLTIIGRNISVDSLNELFDYSLRHISRNNARLNLINVFKINFKKILLKLKKLI